MAGEADQEDNEELKDVPVERTLRVRRHIKRLLLCLQVSL